MSHQVTLEGRIAALAALRARRRRMNLLVLSSSLHSEKSAELMTAAESAGVPVKQAAHEEVAAMATAHDCSPNHGGVLLLAGPVTRYDVPQLADLLATQSEPPLLILLEGIDDARNLGFVVRSAEALGAHGLLIKKHLWDFDDSEIARPSSGAVERLPIAQFDTPASLRPLMRLGIKLFGCLAGVRKTLYQANLAQPVMLAIGGEKRGLSGALREACNGFLTIPSVPGAASLPLTHAASVVLAEARRQRLMKAAAPLVNVPIPDNESTPTSPDTEHDDSDS